MYKLIRSAFIALFVSMIGIAGVSAADLGNGHIDENTTIKDSNDQGSVQAIQGGSDAKYLVFAQLVPGMGALPVFVESGISMCDNDSQQARTPVVMASLLLDERVDTVPKQIDI